MGRSGNLLDIQPKAPGSTLLQQVTHKLVKSTIKALGVKKIKKVLIYPFATGMALTMSLLSLQKLKPNTKYVVFLRIDQKSCFKSILAANLIPLIVDNVEEKNENQIKGLDIDYEDLENKLEKYKDEILGVMSTTSCFAPREPNDSILIGNLCSKYKIFHIINNAYGLQCMKTTEMINYTCNQGLVDLVVQSTDKNFFTPVGGSIVFSTNKKLIETLSSNYPGRAGINSVLDLFISLLQMGKQKLLQLRKERKENFFQFKTKLEILAEELGERVVQTERNRISLAFTLKNIGNQAQEFGSQLYHRGVMGARVVIEKKDPIIISGYEFLNYGGHIEKPYEAFPYITIAIAIGSLPSEQEKFLETFQKVYRKFLKQLQ